jgi:hypothetical protein
MSMRCDGDIFSFKKTHKYSGIVVHELDLYFDIVLLEKVIKNLKLFCLTIRFYIQLNVI